MYQRLKLSGKASLRMYNQSKKGISATNIAEYKRDKKNNNCFVAL